MKAGDLVKMKFVNVVACSKTGKTLYRRSLELLVGAEEHNTVNTIIFNGKDKA